MKRQATHTTGRTKPGRRFLLIANEPLEPTALGAVIGRRADEEAAEALVIAPALNSRLRHWLSDEDEARRRACLRLATSLELLSALGIEADGAVGDADPMQAIIDALHEFDADEIVIAMHPEGRSHWLTHDLVGRARRRFDQPVTQVIGKPSEASTPGRASSRRPARVAWQ
jgi:nucleotide-binding universal stress UspA family protein